jgi:putative two-component system response regulator
MTINEAFEIIKRGKGAHFDPQLVEIFFKIKDEILSIRELFRDEEEIPHLFKLTQKIRT